MATLSSGADAGEPDAGEPVVPAALTIFMPGGGLVLVEARLIMGIVRARFSRVESTGAVRLKL
jgi:hypothetical protein